MTGIRKEGASPFILRGKRRVGMLQLRGSRGNGALEPRPTLLQRLLLLRDLLCHRVEDDRELRQLVASRQTNAVGELPGSEGPGRPLQAFQSRPETGEEQGKHRYGKPECQRQSYERRLLYRSLLSQGPGRGVRDLLIPAFDFLADGVRKNPVGTRAHLHFLERGARTGGAPCLVHCLDDVFATVGEEREHGLPLALDGLH